MKQRILVIDDEISMLKLLERIITEKTPYSVETTNTSLEVPKILEENQYDLIITDLKMPGMDGMDILRLVKEKERMEEVIIITAFGELGSAVEALRIGVFDYLNKPFKKELIINTVNRAMHWQKASKTVKYFCNIFDKEPFDKANKMFMHEYVYRLAIRYDKDEEIMVKQSGLSIDSIRAFLQAVKSQPR